jgi:hypothetical protein
MAIGLQEAAGPSGRLLAGFVVRGCLSLARVVCCKVVVCSRAQSLIGVPLSVVR